MINHILRAKKDIYPNISLINACKSLFFIFKCCLHFNEINEFVRKVNKTPYAHILATKPNVLGFVVWSYINDQWSTKKRFEAISTHYQLLAKLPKHLDVTDAQPKKIIDLSLYSENLSLTLAKWFEREGEISLNLIKNDLRVMSIVFSFGYSEKGLTIFIGCLQGIHSRIPDEKSLAIIKNITKDLEGLRPRYFLIRMVQMIGLSLDVKAIRGISEKYRQRDRKYFKKPLKETNSVNYDDIWLEANGIKLEDGFFELPINPKRRELADISSNKRAQYRRRYVMMDNINQQISNLFETSCV
jgi:uncharacterized protein VirK/YbjX